MEKIVVRWRDIPSQVIVKNGRKRAKALLSPRFQQAVDRAAMRARKHSEDAYMSEWVRNRSDLGTGYPDRADLQAIADSIAQELESTYSEERLLALIRNHGLAGRRHSPTTER